MTHRDYQPIFPNCPVCDENDRVRRHDKPHQGAYICLRDMLLFSGTSAEWARPERQREDITNEIEAARAVLREAAER